MSSTLFTSPRSREFTPAGVVLPQAKLYFYVSGTTTPATTYQNVGLTVAHAQPVVADTGGLFPAIWLDDSVVYDVTLKNSADATQWSVTGAHSSAGNELVLISAQSIEPYADVAVRFKEPTGETKGLVGFTSTTDNTLSMTSYEDTNLRFRTGIPGDDSNFIDRCFMYGSLLASWLGITAGGATGGSSLRFTTNDPSVVKGTVGFASTIDNDMDLSNAVTGGHIELITTGVGRVKVPLASGSAGAPMLAVTGDPDTGLFSSAANTLDVAVAGLSELQVSPSGISLRDGVNAPGAIAGRAILYVDSADGDLKIRFADGFIRTIALDS